MYPNSICSFNIFAATMIGKLFIEGGDTIKRYAEDAGKEYVEDLIAKDTIFLGNKWYGLPDFPTLVSIMTRELRLHSLVA